MFTTWQQIEDWIRDNQFDHWIFSKNNPNDAEKIEKYADSDYYTGDFEDKLAMTKKYLEMNGGCAYGVGYRKPNIIKGGTICQVRLEAQPTAGVGAMQPMHQENIGELESRLRKSITAEMEAKWEKKQYEADRKAFEDEKKAFKEMENGVWGMIVNKVGPAILGAMQARNGFRSVAGIDTNQPIEAEPMQPISQEQGAEQPQEEQSPFTDEEAEELFALMARFKKVEPDYLKLIQAVVTMAENGDATYAMAKGFLVK